MATNGGDNGFRPHVGIRLRLLGPIAVTVLAMLGLAFYGYWRLTQLVLEDAQAQSQGLARQAAGEYSETLNRATELLSAISQFPVVREVKQPTCENTLASLVQELQVYANLGVLSAEGALQCSALGSNPEVNLRDRPWFQHAVTTRRPAVGDFQIGRLTRRPTINVAVPVLDENGEVRQVLFAAVVLEPLGKLLSEVLPPGASVTVIDRKGVVLARSPHSARWVGRDVSQKPLIRQVLQQPQGTGLIDGLDEVRRLYAWTTLGPPGSPEGTVLVGLAEDQLIGAREHVVARTMAVLVLFGLLLLGVMWLISSYTVVRRIDTLARYSRRLQAGAPDTQSGVKGHDELSELAQALEDLAHSNREAIQAREDFLSAATHELRAPLTTLTLQADRLARETAGDEALSRRTARLQNNLGRLSKLVDSLLDVSRLQAGRFDVQRTPIDLVKVVRRTVGRYVDLAEAAGCPMELRCPETLEGSWDAVRLEIAIGNLLSNAIKYGQGKPVTIAVEPLEQEVRLRVTDEGVGIPPEQREEIFGRFQRARTAGGKPGFGFGLFLTRQIVEAHGGTIRVESEVGRGSTFEVRLPR